MHIDRSEQIELKYQHRTLYSLWSVTRTKVLRWCIWWKDCVQLHNKEVTSWKQNKERTKKCVNQSTNKTHLIHTWWVLRRLMFHYSEGDKKTEKLQKPVQSAEEDSRKLLSGLKLAAYTGPAWPCKRVYDDLELSSDTPLTSVKPLVGAPFDAPDTQNTYRQLVSTNDYQCPRQAGQTSRRSLIRSSFPIVQGHKGRQRDRNYVSWLIMRKGTTRGNTLISRGDVLPNFCHIPDLSTPNHNQMFWYWMLQSTPDGHQRVKVELQNRTQIDRAYQNYWKLSLGTP